MQVDWFRGIAITVRYDDETRRVMFVANNGRVPTLEFSAAAFVTAAVENGALALTGAFDRDTKLALKLPPADSEGIARTLCLYLSLPRQPQPLTVEDLARGPESNHVVVEGRCWNYDSGPFLEGKVALVGITGRIQFNAPYRITGLYRRGEREEIRVLAIEHMNPAVTWFDGHTVTMIHAPERGLLGFVPKTGRVADGVYELWLPTLTLASVRFDGVGLVFDGDFKQTGHNTRTQLGGVSADDARAILALLAERMRLPLAPRPITAGEVPAITTATLVTIDGTFRPGHIHGSNFDGGIQLSDRDQFEAGARYRVTGFVYPAFQPVGSYVGYTGPRLQPLAVERV